ncbi:MAG: PepSY domain-containing protein [Armatimonadetes bacterium]|nr:PepSY domain-containing protein [Armatimonadota bacterium]
MKTLRTTLIATALASLTLGAFAQQPTPPKTKFTAAQASKIALKTYPGKRHGKVFLEDEEGKWQYAVSIQVGRKLKEVMVDANTGKIVHVEVTTAAKEAEEAAAEKKHKGGK